MPRPIVYFEVAGPDAAALRTFYSRVFDWGIDEAGRIDLGPGAALRGGIRSDPAERIFYVEVADITAALAEIEGAGGKTVLPRTVVPGVVTFALFLDPAGNRIGLVEAGSAAG